MSIEELRAAFIGRCKNGIGCRSLFNHFLSLKDPGCTVSPPPAPICPPCPSVNGESCSLELSRLPQQNCECQCPDIDLSVLKPPSLHCPEMPPCPVQPVVDYCPPSPSCLVSSPSDLALVLLLTLLFSVGFLMLFLHVARRRRSPAEVATTDLGQKLEVVVDSALPSGVASPEATSRGCLR